MQWQEEKIFLFKFQTDAGDVQFPVRAQTKEEAADTMQKMLSRIQTEIAMEFPKVVNQDFISPAGRFVSGKELDKIAGISPIPPEVLEMRIDTLMLDLGGGQLKGKAKDQTIELWTGLENVEANYTGIVTALEEIKTGVREIPTKNGKK